MTELSYFSDREFGPRTRTEQEITARAWAGIVGITQSLIKEGAFGADFPEHCTDCGVSRIIGNDEHDLSLVLCGEIDIAWPLQTIKIVEPVFVMPTTEPYTPPTPTVLDFIEFCHTHVAQPLEDSSYHRHSHQRTTHRHLELDRRAGQESYRSEVNRTLLEMV